MLWGGALGLLVIVQLMPHLFRLLAAATLRFKPAEYTELDSVPSELSGFREYVNGTLTRSGFTTADYTIDDGVPVFGVVGLSNDGLLGAMAKQAGGTRLQLLVASVLSDGSVLLSALPRTVVLFDLETVRYSASEAHEFDELVREHRLDLQALRRRGIDAIEFDSVHGFIEGSRSHSRESMTSAVSIGHIAPSGDSFRVPRERWLYVMRALQTLEPVHREAMKRSEVLKGAPNSPRRRHPIEFIGYALIVITLGLVGLALALIGLALW